MGIDIEVAVVEAEKEGRSVSGYLFESPEDRRENAADNSVWLDLEITYCFFSLDFECTYTRIIVLNCISSIELSVPCPWTWRSVKVGFYPWRVRVTQWDWPSNLLPTRSLCCSRWVSGLPSQPPPPTTSRCCPMQALCSAGGHGGVRWIPQKQSRKIKKGKKPTHDT